MKYNIDSFRDLRHFIAADLYRYMTSCTVKSFVRGWYIAGFRYTVFMRSCRCFGRKRGIIKLLCYICRIALRHYSVKYGFQIPWQTDIGPGLAIGHYGPIIVNPNSTIGVNCNISVGVLLGLNHKVDAEGRSLGFEYPEVGNRVSLGNNCKIIGGVKVGDGCIVGVGAVVTKSLPANAVAVGCPAREISLAGSRAFVGSFHPWTLQFG